MTKEGDIDSERQDAARRGRTLLYTVGGALAASAVLLDLLPSLGAFASPLRVRALALAGALFLALGRFGTPKLLSGLGKRGRRPG